MQFKPPKAEPPKRKRYWFQFSLRTLMIGVALLAVACAYVGLQAKIVRERETALRQAQEAKVAFPFLELPRNWSELYKQPLPLVRRWLGDEPVEAILCEPTVDPDVVRRLEELFPEANFCG
jgi:hypothetical protein